MKHPRRYIALESLSDDMLLRFYLDWNDAMSEAFGGSRSQTVRRYKCESNTSHTLGGTHATYSDVEKYAIERGVIPPPKTYTRRTMEHLQSAAKETFSVMRVLSRNKTTEVDWNDFKGGSEKVFYTQLALAFSGLAEYSLAEANGENPEPLVDIIRVTDENVDEILTTIKGKMK